MSEDLKCPNCGKRFRVECLASNPVQYEGECLKQCGYFLRWFKRKDPFAEITQEELDQHWYQLNCERS